MRPLVDRRPVAVQRPAPPRACTRLEPGEGQREQVRPCYTKIATLPTRDGVALDTQHVAEGPLGQPQCSAASHQPSRCDRLDRMHQAGNMHWRATPMELKRSFAACLSRTT